MRLGPGSLIADKVRLVRLLGMGGMGQVWLAEHLTLDTQVAVKLISADHAANLEAVARFRREAAAAAKMKSPHAVQILDFGVFQAQPYIVMELLEGEDLAQRIQRSGPLSPAFVAEVVEQVCKALSRAHGLGIVHRDIKPENVFICESLGERLVKVLDFGIAKRRGDTELSMTSTGAALGSPYYMSPEQVVSAKAVDPRSDLWSLGVVAYQALTGKLPFAGETMGALAIAINEGKYPPPSSLRSALPKGVDAFFERVLVRDPGHRFQEAKEMSDGFARAVGLAPIERSVVPEDDQRPSGHVVDASESPTLRQEAPLGLQPTQPSAAVPAMSGTHMTATVSGTRGRSRAALGVVVGAGLVLGLAAVGVAFGTRSGKRESGDGDIARNALATTVVAATSGVAASDPQTLPAPSDTAPEPAPEITPVLPSASASAKPTSKVGTKRIGAPRKKKDRGF